MLTGDSEVTAKAVAKKVGIDEVTSDASLRARPRL
jgi:cation transport ATPase